jgi:hypothetical protein
MIKPLFFSYLNAYPLPLNMIFYAVVDFSINSRYFWNKELESVKSITGRIGTQSFKAIPMPGTGEQSATIAH